MVKVSGAKFHYDDHDTYRVNEAPPVQNTWYEAFDEEDVRHIWCTVYQTNDESAAKDVEVRWTIDGNVYFESLSIADNTTMYVYRDRVPSVGGTAGLVISASKLNAAFYTDKRGKSYKVEVRITSVVGTNQVLRSDNVIETEDLT